MKKIISVLLIALLMSLPACADTLTIDLSTATESELANAQAAISDRLSELRAAAAPEGDTTSISGSGTSIQSGIEISQVPSRIIFTSTSNAKVTLTGGKFDHVYYDSTAYADFIDEPGTYEALVETDSDWTLTVEPILPGGSISVSGTGPYIGDFFTLPGSTIVTITADTSTLGSNSSSFIVNFISPYKNISSFDRSYSVSEFFWGPSEPFSTDAIIKTDGDPSKCFWSVECSPNLSWTITVK